MVQGLHECSRCHMPAPTRAGALQLVLEELLMADVHMHPFEVLGWEGIIGTIFMLVTLAVATVVPGDVSALSAPLSSKASI